MMHRVSILWKANVTVFTASFCVMVIELLAARILAPYIGVSLFTWTSIIGVILTGIALGNYAGGRLADKYPTPLLLVSIFLAGGLLTVAILPEVKIVTSINWFTGLPVMLDITLKTAAIFFLPAMVLSAVSPLVIKLALADLGQTGGIVGTIYAVSTTGAILGTFMTGFFFIMWFGIRMIIWLVAALLILSGIITWLSWRVPNRGIFSLRNIVTWLVMIGILMTFAFFIQLRDNRQDGYIKESNYYTIRVLPGSEADPNVKILYLDLLLHSYTDIGDPTVLKYDYVKIFREMVSYLVRENKAPRILHLGGGGYTFPRYMEHVYPQSVNDVVEIDPAVTEVVYKELGLSRETSIKTFNQDARLYLMERKTPDKYDIVIGDVFNDRSTPYQLTTLEFDRLVKTSLKDDGVYMVNIVDDYDDGRYLPSFLQTLRKAFNNVYLFSTMNVTETRGISTFVIIATDRNIDISDYTNFVSQHETIKMTGNPFNETQLAVYMSGKKPILLTDDYAPTDILVAPLIDKH